MGIKKELKEGTEILIRATVVRRCLDNRDEKDRGYTVRTTRGEVMVEPDDIYFSPREG